MAGSWRHMTTPKGKLLNNENFCGMIENLGDAYEAAEECYGMVWYLAGKVADQTGPYSYPPSREQILEVIREAVTHHNDGLRRGGAQRDR